MNSLEKYSLLILVVFIFNACATLKLQVDEDAILPFPGQKTISHSFYLLGDGGLSPVDSTASAISEFKEELNKANKHSTAIFLGDNIYPKGLPKKEARGRAFAEHQLNVQIDAVKGFKGNTIFIPGNHDWYSDGVDGLKRQEKYIEGKLGKNTFLPENGCPIERINISDDIVLILLDSEWYLTDWDKHPAMNDNCEIKTRTKFFDEFESEIKKARGKTTIVALHHPIYSNGSHGGQYSFASHMKPIPVLGTLKNIIRKTGGIITVDMQNKLYEEFRERIITLSQENDKTIFVSGHDHNLQYIVQDNLPQIVSGAGSKVTATRNIGNGQFSYGSPGYARLDVFKDGSSHVSFFSANDDKIVFETQVIPAEKIAEEVRYANTSKFEVASIYTEEEVKKSGFYKTIWGERYREYFGTKIKAQTVDLDTLFGGLTPIRKGGGHQSKSLRLKDKQGREYVMRALRKNALQYLQAVAFKDQYVEDQLDETITQDLLLDVFTGSHPYAPFTIGTLSDAVGIFHTNPMLYYVPKQNAIGPFNNEFGDELYMIEERTSDGHGDKASFGFSNKLLSTDDFLKKIKKDEDHVLDEAAYIRARLFDMLIGDWDRHEDQWRWASFKENGKTIYRPIPRDRDQAFSIMADGALLSFATSIIPGLRLMKSYEEDLKSPKWFNLEPYPLDMALINESNRDVWDAQVKHITDNLTNTVIDEAFTYFPEEVQGEAIQEIKRKLQGRRRNLQSISDEYYNHINKFGIIKGTNKDDWFDVERIPGGDTKVTAYRIKKGKKADVFHQRKYTCNDTNEIWIYGLDDDDRFHVFGEGNNLIKIRLIGGQNKDVYDIQNGKKVTVYDHKSKESVFVTNNGHKKLTDDYETNIYDYKKLKNSSNQLLPTLGANPDDGFKIGIINTFTDYGFERNPFTSQHTVAAAYYFATQGFDLEYKGEFAHVVGKMNLGIRGHFTSPNYAVNFFGFGNETTNPEADEDDGLDVDLDYNRVKLRTLTVAPSLIWRGRLGASFEVGLSYESIEVEETEGRFINEFIGDNTEINNEYYGVDANYQYANSDSNAFPTLGMMFGLQAGYKNNVDSSKGFGYIIPELGFDYKLVPSGQLVLGTKAKAQVNLGDDFEFFQAANLGGNEGLRGYRNQRFTGKSAFVQSTDLRLNLNQFKTVVLPLSIGFYGGFDYGRVWVDSEDSNKWHTSFGGGVFANIVDMLTFNLSAFNSDDGLRFAFKLGFGF